MPDAHAVQLNKIKHYYETGATRSYAFRIEQLKKLRRAVLQNEQQLYDALHADLKKSPEESWITEVGFVASEITHCLKHLRQWMKSESVPTNLINFPSKSYVLHEPKGVVLIIAPWNYPFQLLFTPLLGAIAAGNCVVLKPSEFSPATSSAMQKIITENFHPDFIRIVEGDGGSVVPAMMKSFRFDHVFYTGSTMIGKKIYAMAAEQLMPVTLELGGKSPCVIETDANLKVAARRIAVAKFSNAGQMCVAPDYILVHNGVRAAFVELLKEYLKQFFSDDASASYSYGRIINEKQFDRLAGYLDQGKILYGGKMDRAKLYIEPTLIEITSLKNEAGLPLMKEEIFGPLLPIIPFDNFAEAKSCIDQNPNPLAFYIFTSDGNKEQQWLRNISFGGGCVNNTAWQLTNPNLPFGGIGNSGIGNYHGKNSFEVFSHHKAIMKTPTWFDPAMKYPPFKGKLGLFKWIVR